MKTAELTGKALEWAVAKCEGIEDIIYNYSGDDSSKYFPSQDWSQGGPIIEREGLELSLYTWGQPDDPNEWSAKDIYWHHDMRGNTALVAAMRCYVASKLGDEVEIPEEIQK